MLDPADRALLNIWVNQGLDDERLADLTGIEIETLAWRKGRLVGRLADELGNPAPEVRAALEQIAATTREAKARSDGEVAMVAGIDEAKEDPTGPAAPTSVGQPADRPGQSSTATEQQAPERGGGRQRGVIAALAALVVAAVVIEIVAASSGHAKRRVVPDRTAAPAPQRNTALAPPSAAKAKAPPVATTPS